MTRELSAKAGATLLRNTFSNKGAPLTHTEALDLFAKLKGFEAWSHLQQATAKSKTPKRIAKRANTEELSEDRVQLPVTVIQRFGTAQAYVEHLENRLGLNKKSDEATLKDLLIQQYGWEGSCPVYPRTAWVDRDRRTDYWDWVLGGIEAQELWWGPEAYAPVLPLHVTLPTGAKSHWNIEQNLSTRWGELNDYAYEQKPGLALLTIDSELYGRLCAQMWDEATFIVRKDGQFGLLFEVEYASRESEADEDDAHTFRPHAEVVTSLVNGLANLQTQYPQVQFCVPDSAYVANDRPAVWGFFKLDALDEPKRKVLGKALYNL